MNEDTSSAALKRFVREPWVWIMLVAIVLNEMVKVR